MKWLFKDAEDRFNDLVDDASDWSAADSLPNDEVVVISA